MRFYVATSFAQKARADRVADYLLARGMQQTFRWTEWRESLPGFAVGPNGERCALWQIAEREIEAIAAAHVVVVVEPVGYGSHVELGAALAAGKPVVLVGATWDPLNPFYHHPAVYRLHDEIDSPEMLERLHGLLLAIDLAQATERRQARGGSWL